MHYVTNKICTKLKKFKFKKILAKIERTLFIRLYNIYSLRYYILELSSTDFNFIK